MLVADVPVFVGAEEGAAALHHKVDLGLDGPVGVLDKPPVDKAAGVGAHLVEPRQLVARHLRGGEAHGRALGLLGDHTSLSVGGMVRGLMR
jgi:hypothetical protein